MANYRREISVGLTIAALSLVLLILRPAYFSAENLNDLMLANLPVLLVAVGMTLVILAGEIDISVGSQFAICGVVAGVVARSGLPAGTAVAASCLVGVAMGAVNGVLVAFAGIPSIVVTLASMVALRDALRWATQGAWVDNLPQTFQWLGLSQAAWPGMVLALSAILVAASAWALSNLRAGRAIVATGSSPESARLIGIHTGSVVFTVFGITGFLGGLSAALNAARFNQVPSNAGLGMEMKVIAAVVVGGASITGGRGSMAGTLLGVTLLAMIGPALTFLGVSPYWEKALQGGIIVAAVVMDALRARKSSVEVSFARSRS
jgi:rhamnose transport system permease protein